MCVARPAVCHLGLAHYLLNQGVLPLGESLVEQLARKNIHPKDIDYVLLTHLHSDHASGLRQLKEAKHILVSGCNGFMI
jgi:glyoxylase-like metal-dependent hydrolase (beta-lactamase superfamily II)